MFNIHSGDMILTVWRTRWCCFAVKAKPRCPPVWLSPAAAPHQERGCRLWSGASGRPPTPWRTGTRQTAAKDDQRFNRLEKMQSDDGRCLAFLPRHADLQRVFVPDVVLKDQSDGGDVSWSEHRPQAAQRYAEVLLCTEKTHQKTSQHQLWCPHRMWEPGSITEAFNADEWWHLNELKTFYSRF